jgi:hypothetical protein
MLDIVHHYIDDDHTGHDHTGHDHTDNPCADHHLARNIDHRCFSWIRHAEATLELGRSLGSRCRHRRHRDAQLHRLTQRRAVDRHHPVVVKPQTVGGTGASPLVPLYA